MAAPDQEMALEAGLLASVLLLITAALALLFGRLSERRDNARQRRREPPEVGEVPASRHANIDAVSGR